MKRKIILGLVVAVLLGTMGTGGYMMYTNMTDYQEAIDEYNEVGENIVVKAEAKQYEADEKEEKVEEITYPELEINFDELKEINDDFVGVIYIPAVETCYPVVHSKDNKEYLKYTYKGTQLKSGSIFLDAYANDDFRDPNTFIFGHNMGNGTMFGSLKRFSKEEGLCDSDPYIYIYLKDKVLKYRIFAYSNEVTAKDKLYADIWDENGYTYSEYIDAALELSSYSEFNPDDVDFSKEPKLLTLSTCYAHGHVNYTMVNSVLIGEANTAVEDNSVFEW